MKPRLTQAVLGPVSEKRSSLSLSHSSQWAPSHLLCLTPSPSLPAFVLEGECIVQQEVVCLGTGPYIILFEAVLGVLFITLTFMSFTQESEVSQELDNYCFISCI